MVGKGFNVGDFVKVSHLAIMKGIVTKVDQPQQADQQLRYDVVEVKTGSMFNVYESQIELLRNRSEDSVEDTLCKLKSGGFTATDIIALKSAGII